MRFQKILQKIEKLKREAKVPALGFPHNVILIHGDARHCLGPLFQKHPLSEIYILFPDPWFKRRHHKHRLINPERVGLFQQLLQAQGKIFFATDDTEYTEWVKACFQAQGWRLEEGQSLYPTYFETKWKKMGKKIDYLCLLAPLTRRP